MDHFNLVIMERQHYLSVSDLVHKVLHCTSLDLQSYFQQYPGKTLEQRQYQEQVWISCKSAHQFLAWYLEQHYTQCPDISSFRHSLSKYLKVVPKRTLSRSLRVEIAYRQQYQCNVCHLFPIPPDFQVDHVIALEDQGEDVADNLQALCIACHSQKTRFNRLRKVPQFSKAAETQHAQFQPPPPTSTFSKYFHQQQSLS
jgi:Zn finger protein HypA/HybF involved in hydrogenase expression